MLRFQQSAVLLLLMLDYCRARGGRFGHERLSRPQMQLQRGYMNRFQPSRIAIALVVFTSLTLGVQTIITSESNAGVALAQEQPRVFRVPFREVNHRILVNVEVDGTPTTLLLDTGARVSVLLNQKGYQCKLRVADRPKGKFALACNDGAPTVGFISPEKQVRFDGFVGADLMSKFASVRIDYGQHLIELEKEAHGRRTVGQAVLRKTKPSRISQAPLARFQ